MATNAANLDQAIANVTKLLMELTTNPKPNYSIDGETWSWSEYWSMLNQQLKTLEESRQRADGPFEIRSQGM